MVLWLNGAFGAGKTSCAYELNRLLPGSFVYDPENFGYFMRKNTPKTIHLPDFQDEALWREANYQVLSLIASRFSGIIIVPMTIVDIRYYNEIIRRLEETGFEVKHFILYASRETLVKRLNKRFERGETWAKAQINRCIEAFDNVIPGEKIITDGKSINGVACEIATLAGISLADDKRGRFRRLIDRKITLIRHIR